MKQLQPWLAAAGAYLFAVVIFTWPLVPRLGTHVWGDRFDAWTTMWLIWHLEDTVTSGNLTEVTDRILYPVGYNLWSFGHAGIQALGALLVGLGASVVVAYNALLLGSFLFSALSAHALGRYLAGTHRAGVLAAVVFTFNPYLYGEMSAGCVELVAAGFLPLFALALLRLCEAPGWPRAWPAALLLAIIGPFNWYYTLFAGLFAVAFAAWRWAAGGALRNRTVAWIGVVVLVAAALDAPLIPKVRQETPPRSTISAETFSAANWDLSNAVSNAQAPLEALDEELLELHDAVQVVVNSTSVIHLVRARFTANPLESTSGALAYALALVGLAAAGRRGWGWAVLAGGFTVLTPGPFLQVDATPPLPAWSQAAPLPYYWLYNEVPFFAKAYRPYRIGVIVLLCLAALTAVGTTRLPRRGTWGLAGLALLIGPLQPHLAAAQPARRSLSDAVIPEVYERLRELPEGAVIELPLLYQPVSPANARFQYNQLAHHKPVLNCNQLIRRTDLLAFREHVEGNGFLEAVLDLGRRPPPYVFTSDDLRELAGQGFRYVVAHPGLEAAPLELSGFHGDVDRLRRTAWQMLESTFGEPVLTSDDTLVFALPDPLPAPGRTYRFDGADRIDVPLPWSTLGLLVRLPEGAVLGLDWPEGAELASSLSMWVHRPAEAPGEGRFVLEGYGAIDTPPGRWTRVELPLRGLGPPRLRAEGGAVRVELDAVQLGGVPL